MAKLAETVVVVNRTKDTTEVFGPFDSWSAADVFARHYGDHHSGRTFAMVMQPVHEAEPRRSGDFPQWAADAAAREIEDRDFGYIDEV